MLPGGAVWRLGAAMELPELPCRAPARAVLGWAAITDCGRPLPVTNAGSDPGEIRLC